MWWFMGSKPPEVATNIHGTWHMLEVLLEHLREPTYEAFKYSYVTLVSSYQEDYKHV